MDTWSIYNYSYSGDPLGSHTVEYKYQRTSTVNAETTYDLHGEYATLNKLVSYIVSIYSLPGAVTNKFVSRLLNALNITNIVSSIFIPSNTIVSARKTSVGWRFTDASNSSLYSMVHGAKYIIKEDGNAHINETYYDGAYYDPLLFNSRDISFATDVHEFLYASNRVDIVRWYDAT